MPVGDKMFKSWDEGTMKMGFTSMDLTNVFSPQDSTYEFLQTVTHEQIHRIVTFISGHREECSLKEESNDFHFNIHLYSLVGVI